MQQCKSAGGLCKGEKVEPDYRVQITEERVGRGFAAPSYGGGQGEALPLPAGGARERHARLARSANPTSIQPDAAMLARSANPTKGS